jgi:hypothetical protein
MRAGKLIITYLLVSLVGGAYGQQEKRFVLLPEGEANSLAKMYPKSGPEKIDGSWQPSRSQIESLEAHLPRISDLTSYGAPKGEKVEHPEQYFRQYLPIVRAGQKLIYVNSLCQTQYISDWRIHIAIVMDGGNCFWQAWYDPTTEKFISLYINGRA